MDNKITETEMETLTGFIGQWLDENGDNDTNDLQAIYDKLTNGEKPCVHCGMKIDKDIWVEELGMCLECSNAYFTEE